MPEQCGNIKAVLEDIQGKGLSSTAKLVAILEACGITDREEVERLIECGSSTLRTAKSALKNERSKTSGARNQALENERERSKTSETLENERQNSSAPSCAHATKESPTEISSFKQTDSREVSQPAFNQASENLIQDAARWMGADRHHAVKWLTSTISASSSEAVMAAYAQLLESQAKGKLIADPIRYIGKTAPTLKGRTAPAEATPLMIDGKPFRVTGVRYAKPREEVGHA